MKQHFITNGSIKIEALEWEGTNPSLTPILFIPGMLGRAESFAKEIESHWQDRRCVSMSLRGRGRSEAPVTGYSLDDHASDIAAVVRGLKLDRGVIVVAHSRGVPYALRFVELHPQAVVTLALMDHRLCIERSRPRGPSGGVRATERISQRRKPFGPFRENLISKI